MANRYQDDQTRGGQQRSGWARGGREREDEGRFSSAEDERDYGSYTETDEGDSSVRAGSYDQGRVQYGRSGSRDSGGSREWRERERGGGRYSGYGDFGQGDYGGRRDYQGANRERPDFRGGNYGGGLYGGANTSGGSYGGGVGASGNDLNYGSGANRGFAGYGFEGTGGREGQSNYSSQSGQGQNQGQSNYGQQPRYGQPDYWRSPYGRSGYGQSDHGQSGYGPTGYGAGYGATGYGSSGGWREPYGEGQQYDQRGQYGGQSSYGGQSGLHRGKGPKGYQRSDERLKEMICERLRDDPEIDPSEVTITVQGGKVTLEGTVDSRHAKNAIEDVAEQFGVQDVQNNLRVQRASSSTESGRSTTGKKGEEGDKSLRQNRH